jgi:hypothetical protein
MKIDTAKLTPIQAQQIEAIASGKPFELRLSHTTMSILDGIAVHLETPDNTKRIITMIGIAEEELNDDESAAWPEYTQQRLENLKRQLAGLPVWHCSNGFRFESLAAAYSACFRHEADRNRLKTMIADALVAKFGPDLTLDNSEWFFTQSVRATFYTWSEAEAWLTTQQALRDAHLAEITATAEETTSTFLSTAPAIVRLRARYSGYTDRSLQARVIRGLIVDLPITVGHWHRNIKAAISKKLDILRPKA